MIAARRGWRRRRLRGCEFYSHLRFLGGRALWPGECFCLAGSAVQRMFRFGERHISENVLVWRALHPGLASTLTQRRLWPGHSARPTNMASSDMCKVHTDTGLTMPSNSATNTTARLSNEKKNSIDVIFLSFESIVITYQALLQLIQQAG